MSKDKTRKELKGYFKKHAIPTEGQFADFIESTLNKVDDGIGKQNDGPLTLQVTSTDDQNKVLYLARKDENSTWALSLSQPDDDTSPANGLSIGTVSDDAITSRLFIDEGTGNVGIGTKPKKALDVAGEISLSAPSLDIQGIALKRTDEDRRKHTWEFWHMNKEYGQNSLQLWEYKTDSSGNDCGGDTEDGAMCIARLTITEGGNVGIGTTDPLAKLTVRGQVIREVAVATGLGPDDDTDSGQISSRVLTFKKVYADTAIRIVYCDNFRVQGYRVGTRWEIRIDGEVPPGGGIYQDKYTDDFAEKGMDQHEPSTIMGYATGVAAGTHTIGVWVGKIPQNDQANAYTGWRGSRWTIEAQEVWIAS